MSGKAEARRRVRGLRAQLSADELARRGAMLADALKAHIPREAVVAGYLPMRTEPDVLPFLRWHHGRQSAVYLPVTPTDGTRRLGWVRWIPGAPMRQHPVLPLSEPDHGPGEAAGLEALAEAARQEGLLVFLVPALAIDTRGARLGQGGGFYDTTLASLDAVLARHPGLRCEVIAVVHSGEVMDPGAFEVEEHDLRVSLAATEYGVFTV